MSRGIVAAHKAIRSSIAAERIRAATEARTIDITSRFSKMIL
jgi:hypothetical protein